MSRELQHAPLHEIATRLALVRTDLDEVMSLIGSVAADWVEMRHTPPNAELDGWRSRDDVVAYLKREADFFPKTFERIAVDASPSVEDGIVVIDPLSFSGTLNGQDRHVTIRYRLTLQFERNRMTRITGTLTPDNNRQDVIAWLKVIERLGGLGQTRALASRPAA